MGKPDGGLERIRDEFAKFEKTMDELRVLKDVAEDLKNYRRMLELKRYD